MIDEMALDARLNIDDVEIRDARYFEDVTYKIKEHMNEKIDSVKLSYLLRRADSLFDRLPEDTKEIVYNELFDIYMKMPRKIRKADY